jgi:hypothetical protein
VQGCLQQPASVQSRVEQADRIIEGALVVEAEREGAGFSLRIHAACAVDCEFQLAQFGALRCQIPSEIMSGTAAPNFLTASQCDRARATDLSISDAARSRFETAAVNIIQDSAIIVSKHWRSGPMREALQAFRKRSASGISAPRVRRRSRAIIPHTLCAEPLKG